MPYDFHWNDDDDRKCAESHEGQQPIADGDGSLALVKKLELQPLDGPARQ